MENLADKKCVACEGGLPPLPLSEIRHYLGLIDKDWQAIDAKKITRNFKFADFKKAMDFVNEAARLAEEEGHHPDIFISYNKVGLELWTHAVNGLSENDFILAAKIDSLLK